uniref:Uncharacterized protein n=1 Tax=CrAss-like virus sp. ctYsL76 TaxID=2826826 RepID=A0A8S5QM67_9CAUD|nr:MAG TPA: hypothetical protein [CrAss-like virus sp. ctYsL76]
MQSFAPMEVITLTDSETNEIFAPVNIFYLEGSDLDKRYMFR